MMRITVNGREIEFERSSVLDLITLFRFKPERITVEMNGGTVAPELYESTPLRDGDVLEIGRG